MGGGKLIWPVAGNRGYRLRPACAGRSGRLATAGRHLPPSDYAANPHVVLDSEGNGTAVWQAGTAPTCVESAYRPAGEGWGAPADLSEPELEGEVVPGEHDAGSPQIVVDRNGNVTVIWERYAGPNKIVLQTVNRPSGGVWTKPVDVAEADQGTHLEPWLAVDWEGNSTASGSRAK